ncbi:MAG: hypothetical protein ACJ8FY_13360 [Gemmataceae bacterium]
MPYLNTSFDEEGESDNAGEYYEPAQTKASFASADDWLREMHQCLVDLGYQSIILRYDGGNDEGFAYFHGAERPDGSTADTTTVARQLLSRPVARHANPTPDDDGRLQVGNIVLREPGTANLRMGCLMDDFADHAASALLGEGYGTGEFTLRGWFRWNLNTGEAIDLPEEP